MWSAFSGVGSQWNLSFGNARRSTREARVRLRKPQAASSPARTSAEREAPSMAETYTSAKASSLSIFTSVTKICCRRGSLISRMSNSDNSCRMRSAMRWSRIPDGMVRFALFHNVTDQRVAGLDVAEISEADAAFVSLADLLDIVLLMAQGGQVAFVDDIRTAVETHLCAAF